MKILITGVTGQIGNEIACYFLTKTKFDLYLVGNKKKVKTLGKKIYFHDLRKPLKIKFDPDIIIHCASKHIFSKNKKNMSYVYKNNIEMSKNLTRFSNEKNVRKFIFFSSIEVYGKINDRELNEKTKVNKPNLYGKSKLDSEQIFFDKKNKFNAICLRLPGVFTLNLKKNFPLIVRIANLIKENKNLNVFHLNKKFNNIIDCYEIFKILKKIIYSKKKEVTGYYNISASEPLKFFQVIKLIKKKFNSDSKFFRKKPSKNSFIISNKKFTKTFKFKFASTFKIVDRCCANLLRN